MHLRSYYGNANTKNAHSYTKIAKPSRLGQIYGTLQLNTDATTLPASINTALLPTLSEQHNARLKLLPKCTRPLLL